MKADNAWDWRAIIAGVAVTAAAAGCGAAINVRDRVAACEMEQKRHEDTDAERQKAILYRLDRIDSKLDKAAP